jgi:hypothetical protein
VPYHHPAAYVGVTGIESFGCWIERIAEVPLTLLDHLRWTIPSEWIEGDEDRLERLLEDIYIRRNKVERILWDVQSIHPHAFPDWR